jgi:allophanate hydrolase
LIVMTVWISRRPDADVAAELASSRGLLAGMRLAVKDNVDAAGLPTTAGCPDFAYLPERDSPAVAALRAAGAVVVGKTNLDQFATGLVGTRSPYGAVTDSRRPECISGGSSSGSAVAVAAGEADIAIGTDTAGSGRIPAALQGIVGIKPTIGLVSTVGVVPACESYDCVTIFARDLALANRAMGVLASGARDRG